MTLDKIVGVRSPMSHSLVGLMEIGSFSNEQIDC